MRIVSSAVSATHHCNTLATTEITGWTIRGGYCQTSSSVIRLGVDFVLPLSEHKQEQEEQEPQPKSIRRGCTQSLNFEITHWLLAEFKG